MIILGILRIILSTILMVIGIFLPSFMLTDMAHLLLAIWGVHGSCTEEDRSKMVEFYHTYDAGVAMFNHPTFYDYMIIVNELKRKFLFFSLANYVFFPISTLYKRYHTCPIRAKSGASQIIKAKIENRKRGELLPALAPAAGKCTMDQAKLAEFRSGGFLARAPVLPIVIKFDNYEPWLPGIPMYKIVWQRLCSLKPVNYRLRVLDPIHPLPDEPLEAFMQRVKDAMENYLATP